MTRLDEVRANRRGKRSRQQVLDAAETVMAQYGYTGATIPRIVAAADVPLSSIYHYFGSKEGLLYAVMERGGQRMAQAVSEPPPGTEPLAALTILLDQLREGIEAHPHFLNLVRATADTAAGGKGKPAQLAHELRELGLTLIRDRIAAALGLEPESELAIRLARFTRATIDGALLAERADRVPLKETLAPLPGAVLAIYDRYRQP